MPGLESCGRCGTSLGLSTATIDVSPPRASRAAKRVRQVVPRRLMYQARDLASEARRALTRSTVMDSRIPLPEPDILSRLIVPGWAHIRSGLVIRGRLFLGVYLTLLLLGLAQWGTGFGSFLLGLAFSVHASSMVDILIRQGTVRFPRMMATAALVSLVLAVLIYAPAGWLLMHVAEPIEYAANAAMFERFDVVLVNRWAYALTAPRRGDVVRFSPLNTSRIAASYQVPGIRVAFEENEVIDRLIGLPGDRVVWDATKLSINGTPVSWKPLLPERLPRYLDLTVPKDRYLILPTTSVGAVRSGGAESFWKDASLIPERDILGRAYLRVSPISRFWFIH
jgi:signal peptidase I